MKLHQLRDCYRQGWTPNWKEDKIKYCILWNGSFYDVYTFIRTSQFLSFQTKELTQQFLDSFRDLIEQAEDLI